MKPPVLLLALLLCSPPAQAQANRWSVTESYAPASDTLGFTTSDVVVVNATITGGGGLQWSSAELGLPATANVDAFSAGLDIFPSMGPAIVIPPATCMMGGFIEAQFSVDPPSTGKGGSHPISVEAASDGAASDTFAARWDSGSVATLRLETDALDVSPLPAQTDIDAMAWRERRRFPVYFSVDPASGAALGFDPAAVYVTLTPFGTPVELFSATELGLGAGDDIDGLAIRAHFGVPVTPDGAVVFSLSRTSPSVAGGGLSAVTAGGLGVTVSSGLAGPWALPVHLDIDPADNINAVRITDPIWDALTFGSLTGPGSLPHPTLTFDNSIGNVNQYVDIEVGHTFQLGIQPPNPTDGWIVFAGIQIPNCSFPFQVPSMLAPMALHPVFSVASSVGVGPAGVQLQFGVPADLVVQGLVVAAGGTIHTSNLVTARVH